MPDKLISQEHPFVSTTMSLLFPRDGKRVYMYILILNMKMTWRHWHTCVTFSLSSAHDFLRTILQTGFPKCLPVENKFPKALLQLVIICYYLVLYTLFCLSQNRIGTDYLLLLLLLLKQDSLWVYLPQDMMENRYSILRFRIVIMVKDKIRAHPTMH